MEAGRPEQPTPCWDLELDPPHRHCRMGVPVAGMQARRSHLSKETGSDVEKEGERQRLSATSRPVRPRVEDVVVPDIDHRDRPHTKKKFPARGRFQSIGPSCWVFLLCQLGIVGAIQQGASGRLCQGGLEGGWWDTKKKIG